jgi:DNA-binding transcriptional regulator GbsR (MarR family)
MNIRALIDIGLVYKSIRTGERREFFIAEKEMSKVVRQIILHRKKKELEPLLHILQEIKTTQDESAEAQVFSKTVENIQLFAQKADTLLDMLVLADVEMLMQMFSQE